MFSGKTALITGGASGLGFLCGKCFSELGAAVVLLDINEDSLIEKSVKSDLAEELQQVSVRTYVSMIRLSKRGILPLRHTGPSISW